jgi:hypothetical protein
MSGRYQHYEVECRLTQLPRSFLFMRLDVVLFTPKRIATASSPSLLHLNVAPRTATTHSVCILTPHIATFDKMLSYPDRHRFEEIRSRWEAVQVSSDRKQLNMVGRKEKLATHQPLNGDDSTNASKFRRKLSQGLSFISLSQRKTTPAHPLLPSNDLSGSVDVPHPHESTRLLSPIRGPSFYGMSVHKKTPETVSPHGNFNAEATPKQLPRSRTMSFIPRPSRGEFESSIVDTGSARTPRPPRTLEEETHVTPTKIPSPDSSAPSHRPSSPRQYHSSLSTQQAKHVTAGDAFSGEKKRSPSKPSPARSYTTPNLVKPTQRRGPDNFVSPRKPNQQRLSGIPGPQRPNLKENSTPVTHHHVKRLSNIQEHSPQTPRREGLVASTISSNRRSTEPASALASSKQRVRTTPPASSKRRSSQNVTQTPFAAQRALPKKRSPAHPLGSRPVLNDETGTQTRLLGPVSSPSSTKTGHAITRSSLPRATTEKDLRKRTFSASKRRMGGGMLARSQGVVNIEVRIPRSSTYHHFVGVEDVPPVPPIPEKYKSASMPMLVSAGKLPENTMTYLEETSGLEQEPQKTSSPSSGSLITALPAMPEFSDVQQTSVREKKSIPTIQIPALGRSFSASLLFSAKYSGLRSTRTPQALDIADIGVSPQVKDYMPALYWAGRFQSRYDQWRTEAMQVELDPDYHMEGPLAHCNVHQEKVAACHIFLLLRELCLSHQAADSLWVSNYSILQL